MIRSIHAHVRVGAPPQVRGPVTVRYEQHDQHWHGSFDLPPRTPMLDVIGQIAFVVNNVDVARATVGQITILGASKARVMFHGSGSPPADD
jgi:hypothetical protein